jgi:hypothetical protein
VKIGAENRNKVIAVGVFFAIAAFLFIRMLVGWNSAAASVPPPKTQQASDFDQAMASAPALPSSAAAKRKNASSQPSLDPRLRLNLLAQSEELEYKGSGRNIFDRESAPVIEKPIAPAIKATAQQQQQQIVPPPPPPPQPIDLKFYGFANSQGEPKQVFLRQGEDVWVAKEGDTVNRRFKVIRINANTVEIEDVLRNYRQTIPLTQG